MIKKAILFFIIFALLLPFGAYCADAEADEAIVDPYRLYTYEQMCSDIAALAEKYPDLISVSSIGESVEGRDIPLFRLGRGDREILICASMHAREYVTTNFVMYMCEQYCASYAADEWFAGLSYRKLLDSVCFVIVPMLNPDGVNLAQNGIENAKNREALEQMELVDTYKSGYYAWKANINGVDLNRNWPYLWSPDKKIQIPASANYNGAEPCTEPEVIAMKALIDTLPFYMFCSFHTSGEVIYWIDTSNTREMALEFAPIISRFADWIGYKMLGYENVNDFGGYMVNYARAAYGRPCFTVELNPMTVDYPFDDYDVLAATIEKVLPLGLLMADEVMKMDAMEIPEPEEPANPEADPVEVKVHIDGVPVEFEDVGPIIENSRTLVPLRAVCEALGLVVAWNSGTATVSDEELTVSLTVGSTEMLVGEEAVSLDAAPKIVEGRTLLPIRAVLEAFGYSLEWNSEQKTVNVLSQKQDIDVVIE